MKRTKLKFSKRALTAVLLCTTFTLGAPFAVMAAETEDETQQAASAEQEAETNEDFLLGGVVVTATRTPVEQFRANANVSVITAADIEKNHWADLSEALRSVPGLYIANYAPAGLQASGSFYINGSNSVVVLVDGVRVSMMDAGFSPQLFTNLDNIERIEVLKGSASTLYGSSAKGGVVNIITKEVGEDFKTTATFGAGSFNTRNFSFSNEGRQNGWSYRLQYQKDISGDFKDGNGVSRHSSLDADTFSVMLKKELNKKSDLTITYDSYYTNENDYRDFDAWPWIKPPLIDKSPGVSKVLFNDSTLKVIYDYRFDDKTSNQLSYLRNLSDRTTSTWSKYKNIPYVESPPGSGNWVQGSWDGTYIASHYNNHTEIETHRISDQFTRQINDDHTMSAGFEYTKEKTLTSVNPDLDNTSLYIQDEWQLSDKWKLTGGVRYDKHSEFGNHTSPSINLGYEFNPNTNMYVSYNEYFIAPRAAELFGSNGNPNLKPESGNTSEIGINHKFNDTFVMTAHLFKRDSTDRIGYNSGAWNPVRGAYGMYDNVGDEKSDGWDIQFKKKFSEYVSAYVGYTHTNVDPTAQRTRNVDGYVPKGAWNIGVDYNKSKLGISLAGRNIIDRVGPQTADALEPFFPQYTYWVWDIGFNYRVTKDAKVFLKVNNIFDTYYAEHSNVRDNWSGTPREWWGAPGRNIYAGVQYTF